MNSRQFPCWSYKRDVNLAVKFLPVKNNTDLSLLGKLVCDGLLFFFLLRFWVRSRITHLLRRLVAIIHDCKLGFSALSQLDFSELFNLAFSDYSGLVFLAFSALSQLGFSELFNLAFLDDSRLVS